MKTGTIGIDPDRHIHGHGGSGRLHASGYLYLHRADTWQARLIGLHAYHCLPWHAGLYLAPCNAIHTLGLRYAIDVLFLDGHQRVIRQCDSLPPWRWVACLRAASVVELPAGYCAAYPDYEDAVSHALQKVAS